MRDHAVGTYGAAALGLDLLVKAGVIAALLERDDAFLALIVAGALSRAAALPLAYTLPYARVEVGPGGVLGGRVSLWSAGGGIVIAAAITIALLGEGGGWMLGAVGLAAVLLGAAYRRWLGGVTGDTLGAASEISETLALAVAAATL
jgi:cobalamin synthase